MIIKVKFWMGYTVFMPKGKLAPTGIEDILKIVCSLCGFCC